MNALYQVCGDIRNAIQDGSNGERRALSTPCLISISKMAGNDVVVNYRTE